MFFKYFQSLTRSKQFSANEEFSFDDDDSLIWIIALFLLEIKSTCLNSIQIGFMAKLPNSETPNESVEMLLSSLEETIKRNKEKNLKIFSLLLNTTYKSIIIRLVLT